jgi:predicted GNAT superfamily acetyltransferase
VTTPRSGAPEDSSSATAPATSEFDIVVARNLDELEAVSDLQAEIWGSRGIAAPSTILRAISVAGGVVLLARAGDRPVGFAYGFTGRTRDGVVYHRSHAAGVLSEFRNSGIGSALKLAQGREVLASGLDRVVWTFDPTQLGNAYFNLRHLGATARAFQRDFYGVRNDALSHGLPTDRLFIEWFLGSREQAELAKQRKRPASASVTVPAGLPAAPGTDLAKVLPLQDELRAQLEAAFAEGLQIIDFDPDFRRYLLSELPSWFPSPAEGGSGSEA